MSPAQAVRMAEAYKEMTVLEQMLYEKACVEEVEEELNREWE